MSEPNEITVENIGTLEWDTNKGYPCTSDFSEIRPMTVQDTSGILLVGAQSDLSHAADLETIFEYIATAALRRLQDADFEGKVLLFFTKIRQLMSVTITCGIYTKSGGGGNGRVS